MAPQRVSFLKSCFRLPGLAGGTSLSGMDFLESEAFACFLLKQITSLTHPGIRLSFQKYLLSGKHGFVASVTVNGRKEILAIATTEQDTFTDAVVKILDALNALIGKQRTALPQESLLQKLAGIFRYQPAPATLHLIETGQDYVVGYLPETLATRLAFSEVRNRDLPELPVFPFPAFSFQPEGTQPLALTICARDTADARILSEFTGLELSNSNGWQVKMGNESVRLRCGNEYKDVIGSLNTLTKDTGARLYIKPYPWNKDLVFFISREEEDPYKGFLFYPGDRKNYLATDNQLKLELTECYTRLNPGDVDALAALTGCYGEVGNHQKALALTIEFLRLAPHNYILQNNQLIAYVHLKRYPEALEAGHLTLRIKPDSAKTKYFMGMAYTQLNDFDKAFEFLNFSVNKDPEEPFHWFALGFVFYRTGDYDQAIKHYKAAIEASETHGTKIAARTSSWYNMACIYSVQNKIAESAHAFRKAVSLDKAYKDDLYEDDELENLRQAMSMEALLGPGA